VEYDKHNFTAEVFQKVYKSAQNLRVHFWVEIGKRICDPRS